MKKIMIVDDDVCIGDMLEELLAKENYSTVRAYSGTEALLYLSSHRPDLILLDLMLPGLSGEELLPLIRNIPVIVLSAKAAVSDKVELLLGGASDYITKPFDPQRTAGPHCRTAEEGNPAAGDVSPVSYLRRHDRLDTSSHGPLQVSGAAGPSYENRVSPY